MDSSIVDFMVRPIPRPISPEGGCAGFLCGRPTFTFDRLIDETAMRYKTDKKQLRTDFEHVEDTARDLVATYLANVQFGRNLFLKAYLGGKFENKKSKFDPRLHRIMMRSQCREELTDIDYSNLFSFRNITDGSILKARTVNAVGGDRDRAVQIGKGIEFGGDNTKMLTDRPDLDPADRIEYLCTMPDGSEVAGVLEIAYSDLHRIDCPWPSALGASAAGGKIKFTVYGRCGEEDAPQQSSVIDDVDVLAGDEPTPTGDEPVLERGYSEGEGHPDGQVFPFYAFILQGVNFGGAAVKIGYTDSGTPRQEIVPDEKLTVTDSVITIASDCVELEDAINAGGVVTFTVTTPNGSDSYEAEVQE